ncbi:MAG: hypothetical protein WKG06_16020 [Segetibacter sp.]
MASLESNKRTSSVGETKDVSKAFNAKLNELAIYTVIFTDRDDGQLPVSSQPEYGGLKDGFATYMAIRKLTRLGPPGTVVSAENAIMNDLKLRKEKVRSYYVAGHLLNHNLHGPGYTWQNLTPLTQTANGEHVRRIEKNLKTGVSQKLPGDGEQGRKFLDYWVRVNYGRTLNKNPRLIRSQNLLILLMLKEKKKESGDC